MIAEELWHDTHRLPTDTVIASVAINPDGRSYASGAEDGFVRLHYFDKDYLEMKDSVPEEDEVEDDDEAENTPAN